MVKGARALCFALQLYIQESHKTHFASIKSLSKMHNIQNFLRNSRPFLANLPESIDACLARYQAITPIQSLFLEQGLQMQIFGKLLEEVKAKKSEKKLLQSPRVRNQACKEYFAFAYFSMMVYQEIQFLEMTPKPQEEQPEPQQYRSAVATKICNTFKEKYGKNIILNPSHSDILYDLPLQQKPEINEVIVNSNVLTERASNLPEQQAPSDCGESTH